MKNETKPTQEEKAAYMAAHIGCQFYAINCLTTLDHVRLDSEAPFGWIDTIGQRIYSFSGMVCLTSLSDITDEDAIEVGRLHGHQDDEDNCWSDEYLLEVGKRVCSHFPDFKTPVAVSDILMIIDYLRSKGYALPWRGYTVEQLIDFGWLKLRQKGGDGNG